MRTIIYTGPFQMPDKNAAAHRVLNNARILRSIGYNVVFVGLNSDANEEFTKTCYKYDDFEIYELKCEGSIEKIKKFSSIGWMKLLIEKYSPAAVIAYDFYASGLFNLKNLCKRKKIKLIADSDEWFSATGNSIIEKVIRQLDSEMRMRILQPGLDGIITVSRFLNDYYKDKLTTVEIPPLVDSFDEKYINNRPEFMKKRLVYSGSPAVIKEALGDVVNCLNRIDDIDFEFRIFGIDEKSFTSIYNMPFNKEKIIFLGRVSHSEALEAVKASDYSIVIRPKNRVTTAGFPTKLVEAISCGTRVIVNDFSNVADYVKDGKNGYLINPLKMEEEFRKILTEKPLPPVEKDKFDYRKYTDIMKNFIEKVGL